MARGTCLRAPSCEAGAHERPCSRGCLTIVNNEIEMVYRRVLALLQNPLIRVAACSADLFRSSTRALRDAAVVNAATVSPATPSDTHCCGLSRRVRTRAARATAIGAIAVPRAHVRVMMTHGTTLPQTIRHRVAIHPTRVSAPDPRMRAGDHSRRAVFGRESSTSRWVANQ